MEKNGKRFGRTKIKDYLCTRKTRNALVAQLVEHLTLNQGVQGSSPCRRTERRQTRNCQSPFSLKTLKHQGDISVILAFLCNFTLLKRNSQNAQ